MHSFICIVVNMCKVFAQFNVELVNVNLNISFSNYKGCKCLQLSFNAYFESSCVLLVRAAVSQNLKAHYFEIDIMSNKLLG